MLLLMCKAENFYYMRYFFQFKIFLSKMLILFCQEAI